MFLLWVYISIRPFGFLSNCSASTRCIPSNAIFARMGEITPPCGVPSSVGNSSFRKTNPAFKNCLSYGFVHGNVLYEPLVADVVEAPFYVSFQHPLGRITVIECCKDVFAHILCTSPFTETKGFCISCGLRHWVKSHGVKSLHDPVIHARDAQRAFYFLTFFLDIHPAERLGFMAFVRQRQHAPHFRCRG